MALSTRLTDTGLGVRQDIDTAEADIDALEVTTGTHTTQLAQITPQYSNRYLRALKTRLSAAKQPVCILLQGDSTGNDVAEWFELAMQWFAARHPAYSKLTRTWSDTTQSYSILYYLTNQVGLSGEAYITQNGLTGNYTATPASAANSITGDLDFSIKINIESAGANENAALISKYGGSAGERGFSWYLRKDLKRMALIWSADGTDFLPIVYSDAIDYTWGQDIWLRVTMDADDGAGHYVIKFYTGANGSQWTQLGSTITGASTTSVFHAETYPLVFGMNSRSTDVWTGKMYQAIVRNGIDGKVVASPNAGLAFPKGITTFGDVEGNVWTITGTINCGNGSPLLLALNGSAPGQAIAYSADVPRFALQTPIEPQLAMINYGHNEASATGFQAALESLATQILTKYANSGVVCVSQNPQISPRSAAQIATQDSINQQIAITAAKNDYGLIDAYSEFMAGVLADLVSADGVHPSTAGNVLWSLVAETFLYPA